MRELRDYVIPPMFKKKFEMEYKKGLEQGVQQGLLRSLEVMLRMKFGIERLKLVPELKKLPLEKLEVIVEAMPDLKDLNQLRELIE